MAIYNEIWFWTGSYGIIGSLSTVLITELLSKRTQLKLERLRLYSGELLRAYTKLYAFTATGSDMFCPPNDIKADFIDLMKGSYSVNVKPHMLFYEKKIRDILSEFESQYACIFNEDLIPKTSFKEFTHRDMRRHFESLRRIIEKKTDWIMDTD
jgi:hypothetical protein